MAEYVLHFSLALLIGLLLLWLFARAVAKKAFYEGETPEETAALDTIEENEGCDGIFPQRVQHSPAPSGRTLRAK